jgi:hypothetical protein
MVGVPCGRGRNRNRNSVNRLVFFGFRLYRCGHIGVVSGVVVDETPPRKRVRHYPVQDLRWLQQRGRSWYAVMEVPRPLRAKLGKRRLIKSLTTRDWSCPKEWCRSGG